MGFGIKELVVILVIVLLLFGTKKLKSLGTDLGSAIKGFRKSVTDDDKDDEENGQLEQQASDSPDAAAQKTAERESK